MVIKSLLNNQIICGIKITKNTSKETKYLKSNFFDFLKNIKDQKIPTVVKNQRDLGLDFHLLDLKTIKEISEN